MYVLLAIKQLIRGFIVTAASHAALLEVKRVQPTHRARTLNEVLNQSGLVDLYLLLVELLWVEVYNSHCVALSIAPHCHLSPVTPRVKEEARVQGRDANKVLVASSHQLVFLRHVEKVVPIDTEDVSCLTRANVKPHSLWVAIYSSVNGEGGLVAVSFPDW